MKCGRDSDVTDAIEKLIREQASEWPLLGRGLDAVEHSETRRVRIDWYDVFVRHIPHRITSTTAAVDADSVRRRACFLCRSNMPTEQRGVALDFGFTAFCNPFPILRNHLTLVHERHQPQAIDGALDAFIEIAAMLRGYFLIYNGPECGASAPDHLHFQACSRELFPIEKDAQQATGSVISNYGRRVFLLRDSSGPALGARVRQLIGLLSEVTGKTPEPLLNIAGFYDDGVWTVIVFPRGKHRPRVYETGELTVSPATIDLCGVFVTPKAGDFDRIQGADIKSIFEEVTLAADPYETVLGRLERTR